ncbi:MAG: ATP phosphoribosyltransferase regulatory subunit [Sandaracinaceae bacterium]|nr:ATP phosphoribosyltransferase regulatory subunit [Sandaracinaceae bacterium]
MELGQVELGLSALAEIDERARPLAADALARKDQAELARILKTAGVATKDRARILALATLDGDMSVLKEARTLFTSPASKRALATLNDVAERIAHLGLGDSLGVDLGEVRRASYYTGVSFTLLAEGPGEPIGAGGRYDNLLAQSDRPLPATGFGLDVDHLEWALASSAAKLAAVPLRVVVAKKDSRSRKPGTTMRYFSSKRDAFTSNASAIKKHKRWSSTIPQTSPKQCRCLSAKYGAKNVDCRNRRSAVGG